jgi:hypothetical protein
MTIDRRIIGVFLLGLVLGSWWTSSATRWTPHTSRPVVTWLAGAAKRLLWIAIVADPPPAEAEARAEARVGEDGYRMVQHGRGW